ncbi:MAG TPA: hypothetical protein VFW38_02550 [Solirubrobacteraceae bacterium]|nr:hypothetical protein [Solirubrobacteraceae bacterium]
MFDGRIYRAALAPLLLVVVIVGFSLGGPVTPLHSTLAPDAFEGGPAYATLRRLLSAFPDRKPGSEGDRRLAAYIAQSLRSLSGNAGGGFQVSTRSFAATTAEGERTLTEVVALRPGSTGDRPIAIVAHRDAATAGSAAELSATAALLELARVFAQSETRRTIVLVSTSGGSEGAATAGPADHLSSTPDAAIVLGDLAGNRAHKPFVLPFAGTAASAPELLQRTLQGAISSEVGTDPGSVGFASQLAHLSLPLAIGEQAPLDAASIPAVTVQVSGVRGPVAGTRVSEARLANFGRAVLSAVYALDEGSDVGQVPSTRLQLGNRALPAWAIRLLVLAALLAPLVTCVDALARLRRRREPLRAGLAWASCGVVPFAVAALFAIVLGGLGMFAAPSGQLSAAAISADSGVAAALTATAVVLIALLFARPALTRRVGADAAEHADAAGLGAMFLLLAVGLLSWLVNPFAALLLVPATHLGLLAADSRPRLLSLPALVLASLPLLALALVYGRELGLGPLALSESVLSALAGGQVGVLAVLLWSVALGSLLSLFALAFAQQRQEHLSGNDGDGNGVPAPVEIFTRGPLTYAGPGSLGGTESALRR